MNVSATPPSPVGIGTQVQLTAGMPGAGNPQFRFSAGYTNGSVQNQAQLIRDYSPNPTCVWTPTDDGLYTLTVSAMDLASVNPTQVFTSCPPTALPSAVNDDYQVTDGGILTVNAANGLLANDVAAGALSIAANSQPANCQLTLNADGSFSYTPNAGCSGTTLHLYRDGRPDYFLAGHGDHHRLLHSGRRSRSLYVVADNTLTSTLPAARQRYGCRRRDAYRALVTAPAHHGHLTLNANGSFTYSPTPAFTVRTALPMPPETRMPLLTGHRDHRRLFSVSSGNCSSPGSQVRRTRHRDDAAGAGDHYRRERRPISNDTDAVAWRWGPAAAAGRSPARSPS